MSLVDTFIAAALERRCRVVRVASETDALAAVRDECSGHPTLVDRGDVLDALAADGMTAMTPEDPWAAAVGVSEARFAAAETGTVALVRSPGAPRRTSVLPLTSVILVDVQRIVPTYADLVEGVATLHPRPTNVQLVTGASRSGDVQGIVVRGMHGPAEVVLVVHG